MPRLNGSGSAAMGIGGMPLSIDGSVPPLFSGMQSGGWDWFTDGVLFGQADVTAPDVFRSYTYTVATPAVPPVEVAASGGNVTAAGNSVWARFLTGGTWRHHVLRRQLSAGGAGGCLRSRTASS